jgi:predicted murein hydrolase (TIGR00659 family)
LIPAGEHRLALVWVYLHTQPLLWLTATLAAYALGAALHDRAGRAPAVNPVAIAVAILVALMLGTGTSYATYFSGAQFVHFLLGPATVALAVPLYRNRAIVARALLPITGALIAGAVTAAGSGMALAWAFGASRQTILSLAPKSVTTPIAMGIAERIGGTPSLTAVLVILTGICGAIIARPLLNAIGVRDWRARGFAVGLAAHGLGTARAFQVDEVAGTFAGIAVGLNGIVTAVIVPLMASWFLPR